jgi:hypothetical protein
MFLLQYWHCLVFFFKMAASHSTMFDILVKVGLGEHYGVFLEQKITPDIVCCLAAIEMQQLGISTIIYLKHVKMMHTLS